MPHSTPGRPLARTTALLAVAAVVGAAAGGAVGSASSQPRAAEVQLALQPDPQVGGTANGSSVDLTTFLQTELVYLNSPALARAVQQQLRTSGEPELTAARVDQSAVVQLTSSAATEAQARSQVQAAADSYVQRRTTAATDAVDAQLQAVQAQIAQVQGQLNALASARQATAAATPEELALQSQLQNVLELQTSLALARQQASQGAVVIQGATPRAPGTPGWLLGLVAGAALALAAAVAVMLLRARFSGRLRSVAQLSDRPVRVVSTALPRVRDAHPADSPAVRRAVQRQAAQLPLLTDPHDPRPVVFAGASGRSGTSFAALQHAAQLARSTPTVLVCAGDAFGEPAAGRLEVAAESPGLGDLVGGSPSTAQVAALLQPTPVPGLRVLTAGHGPQAAAALERLGGRGLLGLLAGTGARVVVDAPALEVSNLALDLAREAGNVVLVAGLGRSRVAELGATLDLMAGADVTVAGVLLTTPAGAPRGGAGSCGRATPVRDEAGAPVQTQARR